MVVLSLLAIYGCAEVPSAEEAAVPDSVVEEGPAPVEVAAPVPPAEPRFDGSAIPLDAAVRARMQGRSHHEGCPVSLDDLRAVQLKHWRFDGTVAQGVLIVHSDHAQTVLQAFRAAFYAGFPMESVRPVSDFGGSDDASMSANNTSAYNCRQVKGTSTYSEHSFGHAIDVNPVHNPWVRGEKVDPPAGKAYLERKPVQPGMLGPDSALVLHMKEAGWGWGGDWSSLKDYQHLSATGR